MIDLIIWIALMMSLASSIGMVWVFNHLVSGGTIVSNHYNDIELVAAISILVLTVIALICFSVGKGKKNG